MNISLYNTEAYAIVLHSCACSEPAETEVSRSGTAWSWEVACLFTAEPGVVGIVVVVCQNSLYIICISVKATSKEMFYRLPKMRGTVLVIHIGESVRFVEFIEQG